MCQSGRRYSVERRGIKKCHAIIYRNSEYRKTDISRHFAKFSVVNTFSEEAARMILLYDLPIRYLFTARYDPKRMQRIISAVRQNAAIYQCQYLQGLQRLRCVRVPAVSLRVAVSRNIFNLLLRHV